MLRSFKRFAFAFPATHEIGELPSWHVCATTHGHDYTVVLEIEADRVSDFAAYGELEDVRQWLAGSLYMKPINDVAPSGKIEELATRIHQRWIGAHPRLVAVRVAEHDYDVLVRDGQRSHTHRFNMAEYRPQESGEVNRWCDREPRTTTAGLMPEYDPEAVYVSSPDRIG